MTEATRGAGGTAPLRRRRDAATWGLRPTAQWYAQVLLNDNPAAYITSGRRTIAQNRRIRGATLLGHTLGNEVDFGGSPVVRRQLAAQARTIPGARVVDKLHGTGPHVHVRFPL